MSDTDISRCPACGQQMRGIDWAYKVLAENERLRARLAEILEVWAGAMRDSDLRRDRLAANLMYDLAVEALK